MENLHQLVILLSVKDSLLSLFSDTESESLASSNEEGDNQRRSPSPQPIIPTAETSLLAPLYEGSPMNILYPGLSGNKRTDLTQGELQDRFKKMISAAVDFVLYTGISDNQSLRYTVKNVFNPHLFLLHWKYRNNLRVWFVFQPFKVRL